MANTSVFAMLIEAFSISKSLNLFLFASQENWVQRTKEKKQAEKLWKAISTKWKESYLFFVIELMIAFQTLIMP